MNKKLFCIDELFALARGPSSSGWFLH